MAISLLASYLALLALCQISSCQGATQLFSAYQNAVYFTNWGIYGRNYQPQDLPASQLTLIFYAFANLDRSGNVYSPDTYADIEKHYPGDSWTDEGNNAYGCVKQLYLLKKANRALKVLLSIGGWTFSTNFPVVASNVSSRQNFARSSVALMSQYGFDGIDIDWEYPADNIEAQNMVYLVQAIRSELDGYASEHASGYHFLLTIASPAGPQNYEKLLLGSMNETVDFFNLMAYDYSGSWSSTTGHQANLYNNPVNTNSTPFQTDEAVTGYISRGVSSAKILLGMPAYGRAFQNTEGPGKLFTGTGSGSWEPGIWDYKALPRIGAQELYDPIAGATYTFDNATLEMVSYDTTDMVERKVEYLQERSLGGSVFWEASGDRSDQGSLVRTSFLALGGQNIIGKSQNLLDYPNSVYENIRSGMPI